MAIPELSDLDGVRDAQLAGARGDRVTITPNAEALAAQGLTEQSIKDTLQQSGVLMAAGTVTEGERTLAVQAGSEVRSAEEIAALPLALSPAALAAQQQAVLEQQAAAAAQQPGVSMSEDAAAGADPASATTTETPATPVTAEPTAVATIGSVAEVNLEPNPEQSISRVNGAPALTIGVTKMSAANTVDVSHAVQNKLDDLKDKLGGAKLTIIFDQAPYVEHSIETLTTEGLLGLVFAVLVILVFLMSIRATLVTAISIPTSVLLTFVGLNFAEYSLNLLTLGALTISIGRVVDDSIVVIENIKRHLSHDSDKAATIVRAVREVAGAITASTITTVAVFLPMAFVDGMVGELFRPFAFTVTIALVASLLVSLTIVPVLAYWFLKPDSEKASRRSRRAERLDAAATADSGEKSVTALQRGYRPIITWTLKRPAVTLVSALLVLVLSGFSAQFMKTNFIGSDEQNSVGLTQALAPGTSLDAQLTQAERVETALKNLPTVETVQVTIGNAGNGMAALFGGGNDGTISYSLTTDPDANQSEVQDQIRKAVEKLDDAGEFSLGQSSGGIAGSTAIEIYVTAPDQKVLVEASDAVEASLKKQGGLRQVESDLGQSRPYLSVVVDRSKAAEVGLTEAAVAGQVAAQMQPSQIGQIMMESDTITVYLSEGEAPNDEAGVNALLIQTAAGPRTLESLATVEVADGPVTIRTENNVRMVTVSALPKGDDLTAAGTAVNTALEEVKLPAGASANIGGVQAQQADSFQQLGLALLAAILIVYVVMVATFRSLLQPLLLLVSVPFAATGAILLLIATGIPLGIPSLIGVLMLVGIVVTNAIVLIDLVNQYRSRGDALRDAVMHGALNRLRPIVMTALATIFALTPMAFGITGKGGFISQPLAVVVIGGLLSSTVLTLVVLPTLYFAVERLRENWRNRRAGAGAPPSGPVRGPEPAGALAVVGGGTAAGAVSAGDPEAVFTSKPWDELGPNETKAQSGDTAQRTALLPAEEETVAAIAPELSSGPNAVEAEAAEPDVVEPMPAETSDSETAASEFGLPGIREVTFNPEPVKMRRPRPALDPEQTPEDSPDTSSRVEPAAEAPADAVPVTTGELNWEELLWQATQEVDDGGASKPAPETNETKAGDPEQGESGPSEHGEHREQD
ncbi:efflux RND transporter permease subunit [Leucobacter coleopterorum]|uniref:efflux RND transporter permease subunit n=1 Tax=Leucobacter coleopterorum TaxID=2714933 RepID=UPI00244DAA3E|nr:efflux RND transporter permease subunit [Leucobacter coleopterorum]